MKPIYTFIVILFFFICCQKKETLEVPAQKGIPIKKDTLELLFSNYLSNGAWKNQFSRLSYSDSVFVIADILGKSDLYIKGNFFLKQDSILGFDSIVKKYHLNEMDILKFSRPSINYQFKEKSACTKLKSNNSKIQSQSVMKSKSGVIYQYIVYEYETPILKICNSKSSYIFNIKNKEFGIIYYDGETPTYDKSSEEVYSHIKLIDITGDGKEELFIFYYTFLSNDNSFDVYQINYLE